MSDAALPDDSRCFTAVVLAETENGATGVEVYSSLVVEKGEQNTEIVRWSVLKVMELWFLRRYISVGWSISCVQ